MLPWQHLFFCIIGESSLKDYSLFISEATSLFVENPVKGMMKNKNNHTEWYSSFYLWCERRDTVLLRKPCLLISPRHGVELLIAHHSATKQFTGLFRLTPRALLGFKSLLMHVNKKNHTEWYSSFYLWCERRDLNPHGLPHAP